MEKLSYKSFVWPRNPHTYKEESFRDGEYRKNDAGEDVFQGMGLLSRTITAEGVFFGERAYEDFRALAELVNSTEPGNLEHPIWGIRYCYLTGLEMTQEPKENCISYKITFRQALTNGVLPKK